MEALVPFSERTQLWIYEHGQGTLECVLAKRQHGFLVALPFGGSPQEELDGGTGASMEAVVGPSLLVEAPGILQTDAGLEQRSELSVQALLVDLSMETAPRLRPYGSDGVPELLLPFAPGELEVFPDPAVLLQLALDWAAGNEEGLERVAYYSAEEGAPDRPQRPKRRAVLRLSKDDPPRWGYFFRTSTTKGRHSKEANDCQLCK
eukprot:s7542_g2.t1